MKEHFQPMCDTQLTQCQRMRIKSHTKFIRSMLGQDIHSKKNRIRISQFNETHVQYRPVSEFDTHFFPQKKIEKS